MKHVLISSILLLASVVAAAGAARDRQKDDRGVWLAIAKAPAKTRAKHNPYEDQPHAVLAGKNSSCSIAPNVTAKTRGESAARLTCTPLRCRMRRRASSSGSCATGIFGRGCLPGPDCRSSAAGRSSPTSNRCARNSCYNEPRGVSATQVTLRKPFEPTLDPREPASSCPCAAPTLSG
jgi:hypothetical protein